MNTQGVFIRPRRRVEQIPDRFKLETFSEMLPGKDGELISDAVKDSYELLYDTGLWIIMKWFWL